MNGSSKGLKPVSGDQELGAEVLFRWQVGPRAVDERSSSSNHVQEGTAEVKSINTVLVSGTWCQWSEKGTPLSAERDVFGRGKLFSGTVRLPYGTHRFRFLVNGEWRHDPQLLCERDEETGEMCNVVEVSPQSVFRLQLPNKAVPDDSAEAVDYINSLKEYDLRIPIARPASLSPRRRSASTRRGSASSMTTAPSKRYVPSSVSAPCLEVSTREAAAVVPLDGDSGDSDRVSVPQESCSISDGDEGCAADGSARVEDGGERPDEEDTSVCDGHADVSVGDVHSSGSRDCGLDLKALGISRGDGTMRLPESGGNTGPRTGGGGLSGIEERQASVDDDNAEADPVSDDLETREQVVPAASATVRRREATVAAVGASLVTSSVRKDGKLLVAMVGLPARGKSFVARAIARHLDWVGLKCRIFSVTQHRRKEIGVFQPATYFEPGGDGEKTRRRIAAEVLDEALDALREDIDIAIYDASNINMQRRRWLADTVAASGLHSQVIFIESICNDEDLVRQNILEVRESSPEYQEQPEDEAEQDFRDRIERYKSAYQPVEASEGYGFIKLLDVGSQMVTNLISGYIPGRITLLCLNLHLKPRPIWMSRHGESEFNMQGRIGGDAPLTSAGVVYAAKLAEFMKQMYPPSPANGEELVVWTSTMVRTGQTVAPMTLDREVVKWSQLREINAGLMDSLTYEYVASEMPQEYEARQKDKLRYRYPGGESYQDLFARLEPVLFEMLRQRSPLLVVGHQAILRVLYGYLTGKAPGDCPTLHMPLHTAIKLTPKAYTCEEEWHLPLEECPNPVEDIKNPISDDQSA